MWAVAATAYLVYVSPWVSTETPRVIRFTQSLDPTVLAQAYGSLLVSPDGSKVVYPARGPEGNQIWVRDLDSLQGRPLPGTANATYVSFAPESRTLAFVVGRELRSIDVAAGLGADTLALIEPDSVRGIAWEADGAIVVGRSEGGGLERLTRATGEFESLTTPESPLASHRFPQVLGDGRILFTIESQANASRSDKGVAVLAPDTGEVTVLEVHGTQARYTASGHLLFFRDGALVAVPFDRRGMVATGPEVVVVRGVEGDPDVGNGQFGISDNGVLAYQTAVGMETRLAFVDRSGRVELLHQDPRRIFSPRISPDGRRIAAALDTANGDVWLFDLERRTYDPLTRLGGPGNPEWSPDGGRIAFQSSHDGARWGIFVQPVDGGGGPERVNMGDLDVFGGLSWHPDGRTIGWNATPGDIWTVSLDASAPVQFTDTEFIEGVPAFSPDGGWIAYASNEQGQNEVYVSPYPGPGRRLLASTDGGVEPKWSPDGSELFYRRGSEMIAVPFDPGSAPPLGAPQRLFSVTARLDPWGVPNYDIARDGRFVMPVGDQDAEPPKLVIVMKWFEELRKLAPAGR